MTRVLRRKISLRQPLPPGKIGNWGIGNEYELLALLTKYDLPNEFVSQAFDMDSFDDDSLMLASAMTYNEHGLSRMTMTAAMATVIRSAPLI